MAKLRSDYHLPEEIIFKILLLIPVKSLARFRSVCKPWRSIISDPQFIKTHLTDSQEKHPSVLGAASSAFDNRTAYIINLNSFGNSVSIQLPFPFIPMEFVSSCNGIVCACNINGSDIYLVNPLTRKYKILPSPEFKKYVRPGVGVGFGYDSIAKDYKVLRILYNQMNYVEVDLYSAKTNSWRTFYIPPSLQSLEGRVTCGVVVKGVMYFKFDDKLISFDLHNEVFKLVLIPGSKCKEAKCWKALEFEGSFAVIFSSVINGSDYEEISVWTLDDVGGVVSWTEKLSFYSGIKIDWESSIFIDGGQIVAKEEGKQHLILYDCEKKAIIKKFQVPPYVRVLLSYTESLVSIKGFKHTREEVTLIDDLHS